MYKGVVPCCYRVSTVSPPLGGAGEMACGTGNQQAHAGFLPLQDTPQVPYVFDAGLAAFDLDDDLLEKRIKPQVGSAFGANSFQLIDVDSERREIVCQ